MSANLVTPGLIFDAETHRYTLAGAQLPSVTGILKARGLIDCRWFTEEARERGSATHQAIHYLSEGDLDWSTLDERVVPRVCAWKDFSELGHWEPLAAELCMADKTRGFAGTLDALGWYQGELALVDFKTGVHQRWHNYQLAAYWMLIKANSKSLGIHSSDLIHYMTCELRADGTHRLHPIDEPITYYAGRFSEALNLTHDLNKETKDAAFHDDLEAA